MQNLKDIQNPANETNYIIISDRWSQEETRVTIGEIEEQAECFSKGRAGKIDPGPPITIKQTIYNGCDVIIDETDEVIAVSEDDYAVWYENNIKF